MNEQHTGISCAPWAILRRSEVWWIWSPEGYVALVQYEADTRLIAAAPDLLAACEHYLLWLDTRRPGGYTEEQVVGEIRAAIAKARGQGRE